MVNYDKTHDIRVLHQACKEAGVDFDLQQSITRTLTRFATKSRYPDEVYDFGEFYECPPTASSIKIEKLAQIAKGIPNR